MSVYLLTIALGNAIVGATAHIQISPPSANHFCFAALQFLATGFFVVLARRFKPLASHDTVALLSVESVDPPTLHIPDDKN